MTFDLTWSLRSRKEHLSVENVSYLRAVTSTSCMHLFNAAEKDADRAFEVNTYFTKKTHRFCFQAVRRKVPSFSVLFYDTENKNIRSKTSKYSSWRRRPHVLNVYFLFEEINDGEIALADVSMTNEFGCPIFYIYTSRAIIKSLEIRLDSQSDNALESSQ